MHGISKEILKLVRASSALHRDRRSLAASAARRSSIASTATIPNTTPSSSISSCCARSGAAVDLRVVVDIIAGASAGGIVGTMLARALSHDLRMEIDARPVARQCRRHGAAVARHQGRRLEQVVPQAVPVGRGQDRHVRRDQGPGGPPEAVAVRALALVPAAARRPHHGRPDVRRGHLDGRAASTRRSRCCRPATIARPVRDAHRFLRLSPARADPRSAADPRARPPSRPAVHLSAAVRRRRSKAISTSTTRRRSPLRRARPRRFRAPSRRRGSSRWTRWWRERHGDLAAARGVHRAIVRAPPARRRRSGGDAVHRRRGAQQPAVPARDLGDPRPAGLPAGRPPAGLYRAASGAAGDAVAASGCRASSRRCAARCRTFRARSR